MKILLCCPSMVHQTQDTRFLRVSRLSRGGGGHNTENARSTDHSLCVYKDRNILFINNFKVAQYPLGVWKLLRVKSLK